MWKAQLNHRGHINGKIEGKEVQFLVDTGATHSLLNFVPKGSVSQDEVSIQGVVGKEEQVLSKPLLLSIGNKGVWGRFVIAEESPACLLGRALLQTLDVHLSPRCTDLINAGVRVISEVQDPDLEIPKTLEAVPRELRSESGAERGLLKPAQPRRTKTRGGLPSAVQQHPGPGKPRKGFKHKYTGTLPKKS